MEAELKDSDYIDSPDDEDLDEDDDDDDAVKDPQLCQIHAAISGGEGQDQIREQLLDTPKDKGKPAILTAKPDDFAIFFSKMNAVRYCSDLPPTFVSGGSKGPPR